MNDSLIRRFCESPKRSLIVTIGTVLLGIMILTPLADQIIENNRNHADLNTELANAEYTTSVLPELEKQTSEALLELEDIESRSVSEETIGKFRSRLVEMVRESGCRIQNLNIAQPAFRPWSSKDNPLLEVNSGVTDNATPFALESRSVRLVITGAAAEALKFLDALKQDGTLDSADKLLVQSDGQGGEVITMNLDMRLFALTRGSR